MQGTVAYLEELGVDVTKVVNRFPPVFGLSMENMQGTVAYLEGLGVDVTKVVNQHPPVLGVQYRKKPSSKGCVSDTGNGTIHIGD